MSKQEIGPRERALQELRERRYGNLQAKATPVAKIKAQIAAIPATKPKKARRHK